MGSFELNQCSGSREARYIEFVQWKAFRLGI